MPSASRWLLYRAAQTNPWRLAKNQLFRAIGVVLYSAVTMSMNFTANQYEYNYSPKRLGNWEVPKEPETGVKTSGKTRWNTLKAKSKATKFIVDERGHILPGYAKTKNAFVYNLPEQTRWPTTNPCIVGSAKATMGYKGIVTDYLPSRTVPLKTVEIPGCRETMYR